MQVHQVNALFSVNTVQYCNIFSFSYDFNSVFFQLSFLIALFLFHQLLLPSLLQLGRRVIWTWNPLESLKAVTGSTCLPERQETLCWHLEEASKGGTLKLVLMAFPYKSCLWPMVPHPLELWVWMWTRSATVLWIFSTEAQITGKIPKLSIYKIESGPGLAVPPGTQLNQA